ncbi:hypothetical protein LPJ72_003672 [Coemansia sp. Benny D160-2]|nr:hypothetical protein LPJ72_003672 [Coemansia sp. Benny D160-2]
MSSMSTDDVLQGLQDIPLQQSMTRDTVFSSTEDDKSLPGDHRTSEEPVSQYPDDVPLLRSCENCRRKKRKCSGDKPTCVRCTAQGEKCTYRPTARFFKPRANGSGSGNGNHRVSHSSKKRASVDHVSSVGGSSMVTKSRFHHYSATGNGLDGLSGSPRRPRAMSTVTAALANMHGTHMALGGSQSAMQQRMPGGVTALAPADLMLSPVAGGGMQTDILPSPSTPSTLQPGSAPCLRQLGDAPQQYFQMQQQSKMGLGRSLNNANAATISGLAYMMPSAAGDEDAMTSSSTYYTSPSTNSTPPQLLLNMDFSFAQPSSSAEPLLSSMAMSMTSDATAVVASPMPNKKQLQQQQNMYPSVAGIVSDVGTTNRVVSSPQPLVADNDFTNLFTNTIKPQHSTAGSMMYSPPISAMSFGSPSVTHVDSIASSYPLYQSAETTTATPSAALAAAAIAAAAAAAANGGGMWPASSLDSTGTMVTPNPYPTMSSIGSFQQACQQNSGTMDMAGSMVGAAGGGFDFILPQNRNLFSDWLT